MSCLTPGATNIENVSDIQKGIVSFVIFIAKFNSVLQEHLNKPHNYNQLTVQPLYYLMS